MSSKLQAVTAAPMKGKGCDTVKEDCAPMKGNGCVTVKEDCDPNDLECVQGNLLKHVIILMAKAKVNIVLHESPALCMAA